MATVGSAVLFAVPLLACESAWAHAVGTSYVTVEQDRNAALQTRVDLNLRDVEFAIGLDSDGDGRITWREVQEQSPALIDYVLRRLSVSRGGTACTLERGDVAIDRHADEPYAALSFLGNCNAAGAIEVRSDLMFDVDDSHRTLLTVDADALSTVSVLTASARAW